MHTHKDTHTHTHTHTHAHAHTHTQTHKHTNTYTHLSGYEQAEERTSAPATTGCWKTYKLRHRFVSTIKIRFEPEIKWACKWGRRRTLPPWRGGGRGAGGGKRFFGLRRLVGCMCDSFACDMIHMGCAHLCGIWLICEMTRSHVCDMTHSHVWDMTHSHMWDMTHSHVWDVTHPCVRHDSCMRFFVLGWWVMCLFWNDSFICVTWLIHMCCMIGVSFRALPVIRMWDMTHSYVRHDSFIYGTWLIRMFDMTHSYVLHDWCILKSLSCQSYVRHDSFICETWLIHIFDMTYSYVRHDWCILKSPSC